MGAPSGFSGLRTSKVGDKTELAKNNVGGVASGVGACGVSEVATGVAALSEY